MLCSSSRGYEWGKIGPEDRADNIKYESNEAAKALK